MVRPRGTGGAGGDIGRRVARRREELGLTHEELAQRAGMAPGYVAYLETHPPALSRSALYRLSRALHTSPDHLLGADTDTPPGAASTAAPRPHVRVLSPDECMELIGPGGVGRVAFAEEGGAPVVLPVNYAVVRGDVVFRTESDGLIADRARGPVAFEVDRLDGAMSEGWSVLLTGRGRVVDDPEESASLEEAAPVRPWAGGQREAHVRITPTGVTGRRIGTGGPLL
ncbi:DNA-binding protein [Glycomyces fuscus]|nr:DNA-binding protein [Glycomyces fuscus]